MQSLLQWSPILWTLRIALLIVVAVVVGVFTLLTARFFRWKHVKRLLAAELPRVQSVGGEFAGTRATIELAHQQDEQLIILTDRVAELHSAVLRLADDLRKGQRR